MTALSEVSLVTDTAGSASALPTCRGCGATLGTGDVFADLGSAPLPNALLTADSLNKPTIHMPLRVLLCKSCLLVQLPAAVYQEELFPASYPYRSGANPAWLAHCRRFADEAAAQFKLGPLSRVLEIGSNDGTGLLRFRGLGIPAMGVEPCRAVAEEALCEGLPTAIEWWTEDYARRLRAGGYQAHLVIARNVLAHVTDLGDFLQGVRAILAPGGTAMFEVPYVGYMIRDGQWDQIYHEHHCYFSIYSLRAALEPQQLYLKRVEHIPIHGGSLRVHVGVTRDPVRVPGYSADIYDALETERQQGLHTDSTYLDFASRPSRDKRVAWARLIDICREAAPNRNCRVVGYGASAKAVTFLNYCGFGPETFEGVVDTTLAKQGKFLPGSRLEVKHPDWLKHNPPDVVVNFLWNWREDSEKHIRELAPDAKIVYLR